MLFETTANITERPPYKNKFHKFYQIRQHRPVLISLFSSFASLAPSRLNHSDTTGIDITKYGTPEKENSQKIDTQARNNESTTWPILDRPQEEPEQDYP
jgi:hypothetical protein